MLADVGLACFGAGSVGANIRVVTNLTFTASSAGLYLKRVLVVTIVVTK